MIETLTLVQQGGRTLVRNARPRRLGSLFLPLRRAYLITMPTLLFAGALLCWATGTDFSMITGALILSVVSLYLVFDLLGRRGPLRVTTVFAITLGLGYGLGTANTWFTLPRGDVTLGEFVHIPVSDLAHAMASVLTSIALLLCIGELYERPIFGEEFELKFNNRSLVFLTVGTAVLLASFAHGSTGFMGSGGNEEIGHAGYLRSLSVWLTGSLLALAVCVALNVKGGFTRNYARVLSVLLFLMVFPIGRRVLIYSVVLVLLGLRLGRYKIPYSPLKKTVLLGVLGLVIYFATIGFFYLRIAGYGMLRPTLVQRVSAAFRLAKEKSYAEIKEQFAQNVQKRTFILGFLGQIEGYAETLPTAHGTDIEEQAQLALPSLLFTEKDLFFTEETLVNSLFGTDFLDEANSIFTAGAVDFGVFGVLVYPLVAAFLFRAFFEVVGELMPTFAACFVILASFTDILEPENTVTAYFVIIRNGVLFGGVVWLIMSLPEFRVRNVDL